MTTIRLKLGDCIERLRELPEGSVDAVICDPPYFLEFMNKEWDKASGEGETEGQRMQASHEAWLHEVYRVLKPQGAVKASSGTRTHHRLGAAMEAVGFSVGWAKNWVHGQGFAKGTDISKGIDRIKGAKRKVVGYKRGVGGENLNDIVRGGKVRDTSEEGSKGVGAYGTGAKQVAVDVPITVPATPEAEKWDGWKTGLSPNWEPVLLGVKEGEPEIRPGATRAVWLTRKPMKASVVQNTLDHGCGGLNIGATRIGSDDITINRWSDGAKVFGGGAGHPFHAVKVKGRWPKNVMLIHSDECEVAGTKSVRSGTAVRHRAGGKNIFSEKSKPTLDDMSYAGEDGLEQMVEWDCEEICPVPGLGDPARFFFQALGVRWGLTEAIWTFLRTLVCHPEGECVVLTEDQRDRDRFWSVRIEDESVHAVIYEGTPGEDDVGNFMRVLKPGGHLVVISPEEELTGHNAACRVEDEGFEIRDSILLLDESKSYTYVAKPASKERHSGVTQRLRKVEIEVAYLEEGVEPEELEGVFSKAQIKKLTKGRSIPADKVPEDAEGLVRIETEVVEKRFCNNHPTVKPRGMFEAQMEDLAPGSVVIDPFVGSGSSALAALKFDIDFTGIDQDPEFLLIAEERARFWDSAQASWDAATIESEAPGSEAEREPTLIEELFGVEDG